MRFSVVAAVLILPAVVQPDARADRVDDVIRIHREALGGADRIKALSALRATGTVVAGGQRVHFSLTAARPDRVRLETGSGSRTLVQATNGRDAPWEFDTGVWPPHYRDMSASTARTFMADAEFDDPLIAGPARGYAFDYAGETTADGRAAIRLLVTRKLQDTFSLLVDADTYLIVLRIESRTSPGGRQLQVATYYSDYRPVDGVLLAHRITVAVDGQPTQQTIIDNVEPNPVLTPETFSRPAVALPKAK
jgi:hypothetical protein